jgi:hypothetical protein
LEDINISVGNENAVMRAAVWYRCDCRFPNTKPWYIQLYGEIY